MPETTGLHLAVALDGTGWHPAAWREPAARPRDLFTAAYWADLAREAEAGLLDFLTLEDSLGIQSTSAFAGSDGRTDQVRGRLDAVLVAARIAPLTHSIGLVPTVVTTHTEPFHVSTAIATLDYVSEGRAGWRPRVSSAPGEAGHFGRREFPLVTRENLTDPAIAAHMGDLFDEAADAVEVVRRLWDSWEDDAVIRDAPHAADILAQVREAEIRTERARHPLQVYADLAVFIDQEPGAAAARKRRLDDLDQDGAEFTTDCAVFTGTPGELADLLLGWRQAAGLDGFRLRPGALPHDLEQITRVLVPELRRRGAFRAGYAESTLRERLGLPRPASVYERSVA
jgi:alkanesulfonate monooxygenase SsuD/methylene tetrahydromethanopterin reductase-like flavin-dependent oxidoreductase (luciferase family)